MNRIKKELLVGLSVWFGASVLGLVFSAVLLPDANSRFTPVEICGAVLFFAAVLALVTFAVRLLNHVEKKFPKNGIAHQCLFFLAVWGTAAAAMGTACFLFSLSAHLVISVRTLLLISCSFAVLTAVLNSGLKHIEKIPKSWPSPDLLEDMDREEHWREIPPRYSIFYLLLDAEEESAVLISKDDSDTLEACFCDGMLHPCNARPEKELLSDACECVAAFATADQRIGKMARSVAARNAGSFIAGLSEGAHKNKITNILLQCCRMDPAETINLTQAEKNFIRGGIQGTLCPPFYEA